MIPQYFAGPVANFTGAMANHLWQSTLFAAIIALVTLAFRNSQARIRFALWLSASIKFLIPFSLLIALGSSMATPRPATEPQAGPSVTITTITRCSSCGFQDASPSSLPGHSAGAASPSRCIAPRHLLKAAK
jgi:hypothetical protein